MSCRGRTAVVTGAGGRGVGRSVALTLAREGANVVVNYHTSDDRALATVDHIHRQGGRAVAVQADVFQARGCQRLLRSAREYFGHVDIVVVNPGAGWHPSDNLAMLDSAAALADLHQEVAPLYHLMTRALPEMYENHWGRFVAVTLSPPFDTESYAYNVAKAARVAAMKSARPEAWQHGVTFNCVGPGAIAEVGSFEEAVELCEHGDAWTQRTAMTPQDVAEAVAFLCSEQARFINGSEIVLDATLPQARQDDANEG